jgi:hypothetical protein
VSKSSNYTKEMYKSPHATRNAPCGTVGKGLLKRKHQNDDVPETNEGSDVIEHMLRFVDRYLATPTGSPEARIAMGKWQADEHRKREARRD